MSTYMRGSQIGGVFVHTSLVAAEPDVAASSLGSLLSGTVVGGIPIHESVVVDDPTLVGLLPNIMQGALVGDLISHVTAIASATIPRLAIRISGTTVYARLVVTTDPLASGLRIVVDSEVLAPKL